jgi:arginase
VPDIRAIVVPYELGRLRGGVGLGPEVLLEHGALDALAARGADVELDVIELEAPDDNEIDTSFMVIARLAEAVRSAREAGEFPVVLSGSCLAAVGVTAGLGESAPGVVWFDAHGDFNEPATSDSGYLDGMGVAIMVGDAWQGLTAQVPGAGAVAESAVVLAGARDLDEPEWPRLERSAINAMPAAALADPAALTGAVAAMSPEPTGLYVHVDLDVLDVGVARVNRYAADGGISADELEASVRALLADDRVRAVSLTAYEPELDPDASVPPIAMRLLALVGERASSA